MNEKFLNRTEEDAWLVQHITGLDKSCYPICRPTTNLMHAVSLLQEFIKTNQKIYPKVSIYYYPDENEFWSVCILGIDGQRYLATGQLLQRAICDALKKAIEREGKNE